ncbi:MAG: hypothetical protein GY822_02840, partial [Deltaproteobacteria bacterium]|nr:hypothetical protein [Deltaproteobacteria bacterium]
MLLFTQSEQEQTGVYMGILRPIITSIIKPVITNIVSVASSISRYYQSYNGNTSYGEFNTPVVMSGDFTASIDFNSTSAAKYGRMLSTATPTINGIELAINDAAPTVILRLTVAGVNTDIDVPIVETLDLHTAEIRRVNNDFYLSVDGGAEATANAAVTIVDFTSVGKRTASGWGNYFWEGYLSNLLIDGTLTFPLVSTDIEYPNERDLTEHMPNGDFVTDDLTGWTPSNATQSVVNNSLELVDAGGSAHTIHLLLVPHADTDYDISIDIKAAAGNTSPLAASVTLGGTVY